MYKEWLLRRFFLSYFYTFIAEKNVTNLLVKADDFAISSMLNIYTLLKFYLQKRSFA